MGDFYKWSLELGTNLITGLASFWSWFISPAFKMDLTWLNNQLPVITVAPWMILSFSAIILIFVISLYHLLNPVG